MTEWIKIEDRLPSIGLGAGIRVLISDGRCVLAAEFYVKSIDGFTGERTHEWRSPDTAASADMLWSAITHWAVWPEPPHPGAAER